MRSPYTVLKELIVIAFITMILLYPINFIFTRKMLKINKENYPMIVGSILLTTSFHVVFEYTGMNEWWCLSQYN